MMKVEEYYMKIFLNGRWRIGILYPIIISVQNLVLVKINGKNRFNDNKLLTKIDLIYIDFWYIFMGKKN